MISGTEGSGTEWLDARDEALDMLRDTMLWNLPEPRWDQVGEAVAGMAAALAGDSLDALWQATGCLQLYGQSRVQIRLVGRADPPAPTAVRERISDLIEALEYAAPVRVPDGAAGPAQHPGQAHRPREKSTGDRP